MLYLQYKLTENLHWKYHCFEIDIIRVLASVLNERSLVFGSQVFVRRITRVQGKSSWKSCQSKSFDFNQEKFWWVFSEWSWHALMASVVISNTVEPLLKDHPFRHRNVVSQDWWSLVTGSVVLKCRTFCQKYVVFQDRWSLVAVVSQDRFHCYVHCASIAHASVCTDDTITDMLGTVTGKLMLWLP